MPRWIRCKKCNGINSMLGRKNKCICCGFDLTKDKKVLRKKEK